jgi:hypothetical protein
MGSRVGTSRAADGRLCAPSRALLDTLRRRLALRRQDGQGLVEFSLALVPLLLILLGVAQFGLAWNRKNDAVHLANEAVRMAVVCGFDTTSGGCNSNPNTFICTNVIVPEAHSDGIRTGSITVPTGSPPNAATATVSSVSVPKIAPLVPNVTGNTVGGTASMPFEATLSTTVTCTF